MNPILECVGLSKKYNNNFYALNNLNLTLEPVSYTHLLIYLLFQQHKYNQRSHDQNSDRKNNDRRF